MSEVGFYICLVEGIFVTVIMTSLFCPQEWHAYNDCNALPLVFCSRGPIEGRQTWTVAHTSLSMEVDLVDPNGLMWIIVYGGQQVVTTSMSLPCGGWLGLRFSCYRPHGDQSARWDWLSEYFFMNHQNRSQIWMKKIRFLLGVSVKLCQISFIWVKFHKFRSFTNICVILKPRRHVYTDHVCKTLK